MARRTAGMADVSRRCLPPLLTHAGLGSGTRALLSLLLLLQATTSSSSSSSSTHSSPPRAPPPPSPGAPPTSFHPAHRPGAGAGPPPPFNTGMGPGLQSQPALTLRGRAGGAVERVGRELPERVIVCVLPAGTQLANGLRHLSTCAVIAMASDRKLLLDPSESMASAFFFQNQACLPCAVISPSEWKGVCEVIDEDAAYNFLLKRHPYTNWHPLVEGTCREGSLKADRIALRSIYAVRPSAMSDANFARSKLAFYSACRWPIELRARAAEWAKEQRFRKGGGRGFLIGVHVRYTDNLHDAQKEKFRLNTSLKDFARAVSAQHVAHGKDATIVLCTDRQVVRDFFASVRLPVKSPPQLPHAGPGGYSQAFFEMLLLSQCDLVIASCSSTFSYEAAFLSGGCDVMQCLSGVWSTVHLQNLAPLPRRPGTKAGAASSSSSREDDSASASGDPEPSTSGDPEPSGPEQQSGSSDVDREPQ